MGLDFYGFDENGAEREDLYFRASVWQSRALEAFTQTAIEAKNLEVPYYGWFNGLESEFTREQCFALATALEEQLNRDPAERWHSEASQGALAILGFVAKLHPGATLDTDSTCCIDRQDVERFIKFLRSVHGFWIC